MSHDSKSLMPFNITEFQKIVNSAKQSYELRVKPQVSVCAPHVAAGGRNVCWDAYVLVVAGKEWWSELIKEVEMEKILAVLLACSGLFLFGATSVAQAFELTSPAFKSGGKIASQFARPAAGGKNISIPLQWSGTPEGTKSFALIIVDQHPIARKWVHWMVINIPPTATSVSEGASGRGMPPGAVELQNTFGTPGYGGPQPPRGTGSHAYVVTLYALKADKLELRPNANLADFQNAIKGKVIQEASITGNYEQ
jgi:Raf kinase inhibitor-like YbhB/YbcL family protein